MPPYIEEGKVRYQQEEDDVNMVWPLKQVHFCSNTALTEGEWKGRGKRMMERNSIYILKAGVLKMQLHRTEVGFPMRQDYVLYCTRVA